MLVESSAFVGLFVGLLVGLFLNGLNFLGLLDFDLFDPPELDFGEVVESFEVVAKGMDATSTLSSSFLLGSLEEGAIGSAVSSAKRFRLLFV